MRRVFPNPLRSTLRTLVGVLLALAAAASVAYVFAGRSASSFLPLWFLGVLVLLAVRYGVWAGVIGSLVAAAIFAHYLYSPIGNLRVTDGAARTNLAWMVLGTIVLSFLFGAGNPTSSDL